MTSTDLLPKLTEKDRKYLQQTAKSEKYVYDFLVSKGLTDSFEEFTAFLKQTKKLADTELSDDELEKVAGGIGETEEQLKVMYNEYLANWQPGQTFGYLETIGKYEPMDYETWKIFSSMLV